jgi:hypothetical protein
MKKKYEIYGHYAFYFVGCILKVGFEQLVFANSVQFPMSNTRVA